MKFILGTDVTADPDDTNVPLICSMTSPIWQKDNKTIESTDKGYTLIPENGTLIVAKVGKWFAELLCGQGGCCSYVRLCLVLIA